MPATLAVGVGVATGEAFVGSIRSTDRLIWSAVGSTTNLASRLQSLTRELGASIAIDETTRERAGYGLRGLTRLPLTITGDVLGGVGELLPGAAGEARDAVDGAVHEAGDLLDKGLGGLLRRDDEKKD